MADEKTFKVEDARIIFRNFAGRADQYNREGNRNFAIVLPEEMANQMASDGWNIKRTNPREEGDEPTCYISAAVSYKIKPPRIVMIAGKSRTQLNEDTVDILDNVDIKLVDVICTGYDWEVGDKVGTKAYVRTMYVTINVDDLDLKYGTYQAAEDD